MKHYGYDGLVISGCSKGLVTIEITAEGEICINDADYLQGKTTGETQSDLGKPALVIRTAGEHKVLYASEMSGDRCFRGGGVSSVIRDNNLKEISTRGLQKTEVGRDLVMPRPIAAAAI